jgi:predicted Holliday junction resolvase-like endonuclease
MFEWVLIFILLTALLIIFYLYARLKGQIEVKARQLYDDWKQKDLKEIEMKMDAEVNKRVEEQLKEKEKSIREDAIKRSTSTIIGKVGEHLAPILIFQNYGIDPKDFRYIGTPIDFIAFKGLSEDNPEKIYFIEIKSGETKTLSEKQKKIKEIVEAKNVEWLTIHLPSEIEKLRSQS